MTAQPMEVHVRVLVAPEGGDFASAFGPGTAALLAGIEETGSLNQAAKNMGMAYSKAWKGLRNTETCLGFRLAERLGPNGSILTEEGKAFLSYYRHLVQVIKRASTRTRFDPDKP